MILKLWFFQNVCQSCFLGKFVPKSGFLQIDWNLRGTLLLYTHYGFNIYFFKILFIHIFWANLVPKPEVLQIDWNLVQGYIAICLFWYSILMFIFSKCLSFIFFEQIWPQSLKFSKLTEIWYRRTLLHAYYDFNV